MSDSWIVQNLRAIVADLSNECIVSELTIDVAEGYQWRIELMYRDLLVKELLNGDLQAAEKEALDYLAQAYGTMGQFIDTLMVRSSPGGNSQHYACPVVITGAVGRPAFQIPHDQLQYLIENRFSVPQIAQLLGISVSTVRRRMSCYNLSIRSTYSMITDAQLDDLVATVQQQFPNRGNRQMYGHLLSRGIRLPFSRVRESQSRVDPEGCMLRRLRNLRRRTYSVQGPQHLWPIDGHHKLIRWVIVKVKSQGWCVSEFSFIVI